MPRRNVAGPSGIGLEAAIDGTVAVAITELVQRQEDEFLRSRVLEQLVYRPTPNLVPLMLERLRNDSSELVRSTAVMAFRPRLDDPGVRAALERARATEASSGMLDLLTQVLGD